MTTTESNVILNAAQAAEFAHVSMKTVLRWITEQHRLPAVKTAAGWQIDQADLETVMRGGQPVMRADVTVDGPPKAPPNPNAVPIHQASAPRQQGLAIGAVERDFARSLAQAIQTAVAAPLQDRLERQAERIGQLEAQLTAATAPKPARRPRTTPTIPRVSIPIEPVAAASVLLRRFTSAELAQIASMIGSNPP